MTNYRWIAGLFLLGSLLSCQSQPKSGQTRQTLYRADSLLQVRIIRAGDSVYAIKQGYASFSASIPYVDSAQLIANRWGDRLMQARAVSARARVYDAWNKDPQQTIHYFQQSVALYKPLTEKRYQYFYYKQLLAHAYDKVRDSTRATAVLTDILNELKHEDTAHLHSFNFIPEMALIATEVRAYSLAEQILSQLTRRTWIRNDPDTYNYTDHYYLTRSRIDVFGQKRLNSPYVDSLEQVFNRSKNLMDSLYYGANLASLTGAQGRYEDAYRYSQIERQLDKRLNQNESVSQMQRALVNSEVAREKNKLVYEAVLKRNRERLLWILAGLLTVISGLSGYLYHRNQAYRVQSIALGAANRQLDDRIEQVHLLNKEIQHRVKNNLHMIYSLLQMQERKSRQPEVVAQLRQARLRVEAIAALNSQLSQEDAPLDLNRYIATMVETVVHCYEKPVVTQLDVDLVALDRIQYLPLALILTEWITNSMKYALPVDNVLHIRISLYRQVSGTCIEYTDTGGKTANVPQPNLGMDIVRLLCRQLNGTLTYPTQSPYHYRLLLPGIA
ncbi:sensor histidine kinase [Fibrella forsythiae]|uniref:histidine kinase n=1 Tax=Fibrella forsythiae TaxID=2817061 RepID=A0ABS3JDW7_9BACT|nr:histidine kinase dimerization/phosphoacceptor domain -containing protein [Fibrella forsythiae]MBO0948188.1 hypothetical protein [Fibrella forsythiae]